MRGKAAIAALLLSVALLFSGCSFAGLDAQTLMHAPKPTGTDEADIQSLLDKTAGGQLTLKYPSHGEYRSAIILHSMRGSGSDESVAFYQKGDDSSATNIMFMQKDKKSGKWQSIGSFSNPSSQVDRICFGDINGDGSDEAVVGWGSSLNNAGVICIYYYDKGSMHELKLNQNYTDMELMDFDGDGKDEIFTADVTVGDQPATAHLLRIKNGGVEVMGTAPLDTGVTKYASVRTGMINKKQNGVVLDGVKASNSMVTDIVYWDRKRKTLEAPFFDSESKTAKSTARNTSVVSKDINGDGIINIPIVVPMPGYSGTAADEADNLTDWERYDTDTGTLTRIVSMVINYTDGYRFILPEKWRGKITTKIDPATRSFSFYQWQKSPKNPGGAAGPQLLRIQVFTKKEWAKKSESGAYFLLSEKDSIIYAAERPAPGNAMSLTKAETQNAFELLSTE